MGLHSQTLRAAASLIGQMPPAHPVVMRLKGRGIRRKPHAGYLIFYVVTERTADVIRVLHGARDDETIIASPADDVGS